jgi:hypothetical protein
MAGATFRSVGWRTATRGSKPLVSAHNYLRKKLCEVAIVNIFGANLPALLFDLVEDCSSRSNLILVIFNRL